MTHRICRKSLDKHPPPHCSPNTTVSWQLSQRSLFPFKVGQLQVSGGRLKSEGRGHEEAVKVAIIKRCSGLVFWKLCSTPVCTSKPPLCGLNMQRKVLFVNRRSWLILSEYIHNKIRYNVGNYVLVLSNTLCSAAHTG